MKKWMILLMVSLLALGLFVGCAAEEPEEPADMEEPADDVEEPADDPVDEPDDVVETETYSAVSEANQRGYVEIEIDVEGDEIVAARVTEYDGFGFEKDYETYANGGELWPYLEESHRALEDWIVEDNTWDVDTFTEATGTSDKTRSAAKHAMIRAGLEQGDGEYFDGTFMGVSSKSDRGAFGVALVTIENDEIVAVELEEAALDDDDEYEFKDEDYGWDEFHEAKEIMPEWFIEAQGPDVDIYTEATGSANMWMEAVENALNAARIN